MTVLVELAGKIMDGLKEAVVIGPLLVIVVATGVPLMESEIELVFTCVELPSSSSAMMAASGGAFCAGGERNMTSIGRFGGGCNAQAIAASKSAVALVLYVAAGVLAL